MALLRKKEKSGFQDALVGEDLYKLIAATMQENDLVYEANPGKLYVKVQFQGDDLTITTFISADKDSNILSFDCPLEFEVEEENKDTILESINGINNSIHLGTFTLRDDRVWYRYHMVPFGKLTTDDVAFLLQLVASTVDDHDGQLDALIHKRSSPKNVMYG